MPSVLRKATPWLGYLLLLVVGLVSAKAGYASSNNHPNDWMEFEIGARTFVHWHHMMIYDLPALHLYAENSALQIGPPSFLLIAPFEFLSPRTVNIGFVVAMVAMGLAAIRFAELAARALRPASASRRTTLVLGATPLMAAWGYYSGQFHHLDDALTLTAIAAAVWLCASRRMPVAVGILLGLAVAAKPWGIVCVPVLLSLPRIQRPRAVVALMVVVIGFWLPFVLGDSQTLPALGGYHILPMPGSDLALMGIHHNLAGWLRPTQFGLGIAAGIWMARRGHWAAAPLAGIAMRVALDPFTWAYYGFGPVLAALLWDLARPGSRRIPTWTLFTVAIEFGLRLVLSPTETGIGRVGWVLSVCGLMVALHRRGPSPVTPDVTPAPEPDLAVTGSLAAVAIAG